MRCLTLALISYVFCTGCQATRLQKHTVEQAPTVNDIYYEQVLNNIAAHYGNPAMLPYFSYPSTGQNAVQRSLTANYQLSWDLVESAGKLFNRYLADKQSAMLSGSAQNNETWNTVVTSDPDKLMVMKYAYDKLFGPIGVDEDKKLWDILEFNPNEKPKEDTKEKTTIPLIPLANGVKKVDGPPPKLFEPSVAPHQISGVSPDFHIGYYKYVKPGWFGIGERCDVPKSACYVGRCGKSYAWVTAENVADLSMFTLAMLDIATFQAPGKQSPIASFGTSTLPGR